MFVLFKDDLPPLCLFQRLGLLNNSPESGALQTT